jgi:hypothetical protein
MRNAIKIPLILLAAALGMLLLLAGAGAFYYFSTTQLQVTDTDRALIVGPASIKPYFEDYVPMLNAVSYQKVKYIDGQVEYDVEPLNQPYMSVVITDSRSKADTMSNYLIAWNAMVAVFNAIDAKYEVVEDNSVIKLGDRSRFAFIKYEDSTVGNMFLFVSGNKLYEFTMTGYYIESPEIWEELFREKVNGLAAFNKAKSSR